MSVSTSIGKKKFDLVKEEAERDAALKAIAAKNRDLVDRAKEIAIKICARRGSVTSTQVFEEMNKHDELAAQIKASDKRWMGAVFRSKIWTREGWVIGGSHGRPVSVWTSTKR